MDALCRRGRLDGKVVKFGNYVLSVQQVLLQSFIRGLAIVVQLIDVNYEFIHHLFEDILQHVSLGLSQFVNFIQVQKLIVIQHFKKMKIVLQVFQFFIIIYYFGQLVIHLGAVDCVGD